MFYSFGTGIKIGLNINTMALGWICCHKSSPGVFFCGLPTGYVLSFLSLS